MTDAIKQGFDGFRQLNKVLAENKAKAVKDAENKAAIERAEAYRAAKRARGEAPYVTSPRK